MSEPGLRFEKIYVRQDCAGLPMTRRVLTRLPLIPVETVSDERGLVEDIRLSADPVGLGKRTLLVTRNRGGFVKPCPCTPGYVGCGYFIINADLNCPLDCTYCILQGYLTNPVVTVHANTEALWSQLDAFLQGRRRPVRIGTGELGDSLALDPLTGRAADLIDYFRTRAQGWLELKTKTVNIDGVLSRQPAENVIVAWSLNSAPAAADEEGGAPSVEERLEAAEVVARKGFRVAFHFDQLLVHPGWREGYAATADLLLRKIDPRRMAWISLGSLRFPASLEPIIRRRFPRSRLLLEELVPGLDKKLRYPRELRVSLYRELAAMLKGATAAGVPLYFCMESPEVWKDALDKKIRGKGGLERSLTLPLDS